MQTANVMVALGGHKGNTVPKYGVTASEIAVLRAIHGDDAIFDIEPLGVVNISQRAERARLHDRYGRARDGQQNLVVEKLFPGAASRVFETLSELDIPRAFYKPLTRASDDAIAQVAPAPAPIAPAPAPTATEDDGIGDIKDEHADLTPAPAPVAPASAADVLG